MPTPPVPLPSRALTAAFTLADGRVTVGSLARACGITTSVVGRWLRHDGVVSDPAIINDIRVAFRKAGVVLKHNPDGDDDHDDALLVDDWIVWPVG